MITDLDAVLSDSVPDATCEAITRRERALLAPASLVFSVLDDERAEFESLPDSIRDDVKRGLIAFEKIHSSKNVSHACKKIAALMVGRRGFSFHRLRAKYYEYVRTGDWRVLVDNARIPKRLKPDAAAEAATDLPRDFIEFLKGLMQSNQRKSEPAIRLLYRMWRRGESIPGYGTWLEWFQDTFPHEPLPCDAATGEPVCPPELPVGWSKGNLRRYIPEDAELALAREGVAAARSHLPGVLTTRVGLRPLEVIFFDDLKTDFKIQVPGFEDPVDLYLLVAYDLATGMILRYGLRPAIWRDDGSRERLKLRDMKVLIAGLLLEYGVPRDYVMLFVLENQTATIRDGTALALNQLSCGQIEHSKTMMINGTAIWAGYKDRALGNPNGKASLESTFNLVHNELGFQPGQTGRRYDVQPAELHGRTRENQSLARTDRYLTPHQRAALRRPFLNTAQARIVLTDAFNRMIRRDDHVMEGFEEIGLWRTRDFEQWKSETEMPLDLDPASVQWSRRKESPYERWLRLVEIEETRAASLSALGRGTKGEVSAAPSLSALGRGTKGEVSAAFTKLHPGAIARLYDEQKLVPVRDGEIYFTFEAKSYVYRVAKLQFAAAGKSPAVILPNGAKPLVWFDPQDLTWIHLTSPDGGYLGSIQLEKGVKRTDTLAAKAEVQRLQDQMTELQRTVSSRMPQVAEQRIEDLQHNVNVLTEALADSSAIPIQAASLSAGGEGQGEVVPRSASLSAGGEGQGEVDSPSVTAPLPAFVQQIEQSKHALKVADRKAAARKQTAAELAEAADAALMTNLR